MVFDLLGLFLVFIIGLPVVISTVYAMVRNHDRTVMGWYWNIIYVLVGVGCIYVGGTRLFPPQTMFSSATNAVGLTGGRRWY
jgi:hypothetical protein